MNTSRLSICGTVARPCPNCSLLELGTRRGASSGFDFIRMTKVFGSDIHVDMARRSRKGARIEGNL